MMECPSVTTVALATIYVGLGSARVMLMRESANEDHKYNYLPVTVNVCAEAVKLIVCLSIMIRMELNGKPMFRDIVHFRWPDFIQFFKWSVPGLFYFLDNLIGFYVMTYFEPAVALLLGNFNIISTSLLFRIILKRKLSHVQWASLLILFLAIVSLSNQDHKPALSNHRTPTTLDTLDNATLSDLIILERRQAIPVDFCHKHPRHISESTTNDEEDKYSFNISLGHVLVIVQCFLASLANVYNEKIFKEGNNFQESIFLQNTRLYIFGVVFNSLTLLVIPQFRNHIIYCGMFNGYNVYSTVLIFDTALIGLTISLILKFRDNMFHMHSAQVTTVTVITLSIWLTGFQPTLDFFLQMPTVFIAIYIYNKSCLTPDPPTSPRRRYPSESGRGPGGQRKRGTSLSEERIELVRVGEDEEEEEQEQEENLHADRSELP